MVRIILNSFKQFVEVNKGQVKDVEQAKDIGQDIGQHQGHDIGQEYYMKIMKLLISIINILIESKLWNITEDNDITNPIEFIYSILVEQSSLKLANKEYFKWLSEFLDKTSNYNLINQEKTFKLFNERILLSESNCKEIDLNAFNSYLKIFLDYNKTKDNLNYSIVSIKV